MGGKLPNIYYIVSAIFEQIKVSSIRVVCIIKIHVSA